MPTTLPNGLVIYNVTPHELVFWWEETKTEIIAPSDEVVNAMPLTTTVQRNRLYHLTKIEYTHLNKGNQIIGRIREENPKALIIGSIIAAMAYPGVVLASVPYHKERGSALKHKRLIRTDRFTTF